MTEKNQGKPENRRRKMADSDEESGEEEAAIVAAEKTAMKKKSKPDKCQSESNVAEDCDDVLIDAYARLGLKDRREKRKLKLESHDYREEVEEKASTKHSKSDEKDDVEEEAMSDKRKTDNKEGPAAKKPKKPEGMRGKSKILFVNNLSINTDEYSLMAAFGGAVSARIPKFLYTGNSRGFGYVYFTSAEAAADAFDSMNGESIDGRQVTLEFGIGKGPGGGGFGVRGDRRGLRGGGGFNKVRYSSERNGTVRQLLMILIKHHQSRQCCIM